MSKAPSSSASPSPPNPSVGGSNAMMTLLMKRGYLGFSLIESGGQANVYRSSRASDGRPLAIKVTKVAEPDKDQAKLDEDLRRELMIVHNLKHPNCIRVEDIFRTRDRVYIVMDFMPGGTMDNVVEKGGPLNEWNAMLWMTAILRAIKYLHRCRIAHRDLKLDNILLDAHANPIVSDFGFALFVSPDPTTECGWKLSDTWCGTLAYHAPEINAETLPYNPFKVDIWCCGVMLFVAVNQHYPFDHHDQAKMRLAQLNREYRLQPTIESRLTADCKALIRLLLEPEAKDRPSIDTVCSHPWLPVVSREVDILAAGHSRKQSI